MAHIMWPYDMGDLKMADSDSLASGHGRLNHGSGRSEGQFCVHAHYVPRLLITDPDPGYVYVKFFVDFKTQHRIQLNISVTWSRMCQMCRIYDIHIMIT